MKKKYITVPAICCLVSLISVINAVNVQAAGTSKKVKPAKKVPVYDASVPKPTLTEVRYGKHERQVLDFWKASSDSPTPLVFAIHGGGWRGGSKELIHRFVDTAALLKAGISVVAINYRLVAHAEDVQPPVKVPLYDAARALQFVRSRADEWNIDKNRIAAAGESAGACSSLWLAYHDDLADPKSDSDIARESTRFCCVALKGAQTTLDPKKMKKWTPNSHYGWHAFGKKNFPEFLADREKLLPWIVEYSPYALVSKDAPPTYLFYNTPPDIGKKQKDPTHSANFGAMLKKRCKKLKVKCDVMYPGASKVKYKTPTDYLIAKLNDRSGTSRKK